jgi:predicted hotdog family 3-hydroxylacyl-ACP dehydratase
MTRDEIQKIIPHREDMMLLDEAVLDDGVARGSTPSGAMSSFCAGTFRAIPWCRA